MPLYDFGCDQCGFTKEILASLAEHERGIVAHCPKDRTRLVQRVSRPYIAPDWKPYTDIASSRKLLRGGRSEYRELVMRRKDKGIYPLD